MLEVQIIWSDLDIVLTDEPLKKVHLYNLSKCFYYIQKQAQNIYHSVCEENIWHQATYLRKKNACYTRQKTCP